MNSFIYISKLVKEDLVQALSGCSVELTINLSVSYDCLLISNKISFDYRTVNLQLQMQTRIREEIRRNTYLLDNA